MPQNSSIGCTTFCAEACSIVVNATYMEELTVTKMVSLKLVDLKKQKNKKKLMNYLCTDSYDKRFVLNHHKKLANSLLLCARQKLLSEDVENTVDHLWQGLKVLVKWKTV